MDKLKEYMEQHKTAMDVDTPPDRIWLHIQAKTPHASAGRQMYRMAKYTVAAACILLAGIGIWFTTKKTKEQEQASILEKQIPVQKKTVVAGKKDTAVNSPLQETAWQKPKYTALRRKEHNPLPNGVFNEANIVGKSYSKLINYQLKRLRSTPVYAESQNYFTAFRQQLQQMDEDEALLKKDIQAYGLNDQLLDALINIYQQKLNLLKGLQTEINKMNKIMKDKQSPDELQVYYLNL